MKKSKKLLPALLLTLVGTITLGVGASAKVVEINEKNFPDPVLREAVKEYLYDDYDGEVVSTNTIDTDNVQDLYIETSTPVGELTGLELFTNLKYLSFAYKGSSLTLNQSLVDLSVIMEGEENIKVDAVNTTGWVSVFAVNSTKNVTVKAPKVAYGVKVVTQKATGGVTVDAINASNIDIFSNVSSDKVELIVPKMTRLQVSGNFGITYDYGQYKNLEALYITDCATSKVNGLDQLTNLTSLTCYKTKLTSLNVSKHTKLKSLDISWSPVKSIDVSKLSNLKKLKIAGTKITSLNLSKNKQLEFLDVSSTKVKNLKLSKLKKLRILDIASTPMKKVEVSKLSKLENIDISNSKITWVDLTKNRKVKYINLSLKKGKSFDVSKFIGKGWKKEDCSSGLKYNKNMSKLTLKKNPKDSYQYILLKKGKRYVSFCITAKGK